ncbi:hypothetical protein GCM10009077_09710 [Roseibium denhamense]
MFPWSPDFPPPRPFGASGSGCPADWPAWLMRLWGQGQAKRLAANVFYKGHDAFSSLYANRGARRWSV